MQLAYGHKRILFIDGYESDRQDWVARLSIRAPNYRILEAEDGRSGLAIYQSARIDCVITELMLPDTSGFQLLVDLVPRVHSPQVAVVVLSRLATPQIATLVRKNGAQAYLMKSQASDLELIKALHKAMRAVRRHGDNEPSQRPESLI